MTTAELPEIEQTIPLPGAVLGEAAATFGGTCSLTWLVGARQGDGRSQAGARPLVGTPEHAPPWPPNRCLAQSVLPVAAATLSPGGAAAPVRWAQQLLVHVIGGQIPRLDLEIRIR
jgi:hypothetical protein